MLSLNFTGICLNLSGSIFDAFLNILTVCPHLVIYDLTWISSEFSTVFLCFK